jgi:DNA-binding beta-propeller fold protein YncE
MKRNLLIGAGFLVVIAGLGIGQGLFARAEAQAAQGTVMAPRFEVDPTWPKTLPNNWQLGQTIGVSVDAKDHVWIVHRANPDAIEDAGTNKTGLCCTAGDPIMEFDQAGTLLRHWGGKDGPGYQWPSSNHGIWIDYKGNVWIGGNGGGDGHILKFTQDGKFIMQVGKKGVAQDSNATDHFYMVAKIHIYPKTNEVFVADGYGNKRVAVVDADTGKFKRYWGAYGNRPDDAAATVTVMGPYTPGGALAKQFRGPVHCAEPSNDGLVYVCDRTNDRVQVFRLDGTYVTEIQVMPESKGDGSTWDVDFSKDPEQKYMFLADGRNQKVHIYDRKSLVELTNFGTGGHYPGQWYSLHSIALDSKGNLYTTETYQGRRVQKFTYKGLAPVTKKEQGAVWPSSN